MSADALLDAIEALPEPPCTGCPLYSQCARAEIACTAFYNYVYEYAPAKEPPRVPTHDIYAHIYYGTALTVHNKRLDPEQVRDIRAATGTTADIKRATGLSYQCIARIRSGKAYADIV